MEITELENWIAGGLAIALFLGGMLMLFTTVFTSNKSTSCNFGLVWGLGKAPVISRLDGKTPETTNMEKTHLKIPITRRSPGNRFGMIGESKIAFLFT